ncbi:hypothetical protein [Enterobacter kobei]
MIKNMLPVLLLAVCTVQAATFKKGVYCEDIPAVLQSVAAYQNNDIGVQDSLIKSGKCTIVSEPMTIDNDVYVTLNTIALKQRIVTFSHTGVVGASLESFITGATYINPFTHKRYKSVSDLEKDLNK